MADNSRTNYGLEITGYIFKVASHRIGKAIVDILRENFTGDGKMQRGDFYMNQSRELLRRHLEIIRRDDKPIIQEKYADARVIQTKLEGIRGSRLKRFFTAMEYKRLCKGAYKMVEKASNRAVDLMNQMDEAMHETDDSQSTSESLQSTHSNLFFSDSSSMSSDVPVSGLSQIAVEAHQSQVTRDTAIVLGLHRQDASTQHIIATFSATVFSNPAQTA